MQLIQLFWSFFQIGLFSIGGGYAAMPLIQQQVVDAHAWLTLGEFADIVTIAEMTPGPIAINAATFVGNQVSGLPGAIIATLGCIAPACVIVICLAKLYYKYRSLTLMQGVLGGLRPAVVAMIASAGLSILLLCVFGGQGYAWANVEWVSVALFGLSLAVLRIFKPNPILVMVGAGLVGLAGYALF